MDQKKLLIWTLFMSVLFPHSAILAWQIKKTQIFKTNQLNKWYKASNERSIVYNSCSIETWCFKRRFS